MILFIDGVETAPVDVFDDLQRAVIVSLFSWRRADKEDILHDTNKFGWWGDTYAQIINDRIGSKFWLLLRAKMLQETVSIAVEYAKQATQWLIDDGVATQVLITAQIQTMSALAVSVIIIKGDKQLLNMRFDNVWNFANV